MANNRRGKGLIGLLFVLLIWGATAVLAAVPAEINYQGSIEDLNGPVDGTLDLTFRLFDADVAGIIVWEESHSVVVNQGIYNVILSTGTINPSYGSLEEAVFENDDLWLEVQVAGEADAMAPRQKITSVGFAMRAGSVSDGTITATMLANEAVTTEKLEDGAVTAAKVTGGFVPDLDADLLDGLSANAFSPISHTHDTLYYTQAQVDALVSGQVSVEELLVLGTARVGSLVGNGGVMTVGTEDHSALELQVWGVPALSIAPPATAGSAPSILGGWVSNTITAGVEGGVVAGGGTPLYSGNPRPNRVTDHFGVVSGGMGNQSGNGGTTLDDAQGATVGGGYANTASANWATVGGGWYNRVTYERGTVGGGWNNLSSGEASAVSGGRDNQATGSIATVPGGQANRAQGAGSFAAGYHAKADHNGSFVWADYQAVDYGSTAINQFLIRATGGVGIGTDSPAEMLDVNGNVKIQGTGNGLLFPDGSKQTTAVTLPYIGTLSTANEAFKVTNSGSGEAIEGVNSTSGNYGQLGTSGYGVYGRAVEAGDTGVYGWAPSSSGGNGVLGISPFGTGVNGQSLDGYGVYAVATGDSGIGLYAKGTEFGFAAFFDGWIQGPLKIEGALEIRGGADLSEAFDIRTASPQIEPEAGMLVSIDREHPGGLLVSQKAYDRCVAGIISGAGGIMPAMVMGQEEHKEESGLPVALTGRVYCMADISNGFIEPGDLLTSSSIPGHAMKVTDYERAQGAVIGKAMSALEEDRGMVLVLVNLQ